MNISVLVDAIQQQGVQLFAGVPDSQLKPLCDYLMKKMGISQKHIIAPNEGICVALAAGEYLSTGKPACVYMQNSGLGNIVNPVCSLTHPKVYGIPTVFVVGWRGEPGVHDEPQHIYQGEVTLKTLEVLGISYIVLSSDTQEEEFVRDFSSLCKDLSQGKSVAVVIKKGSLQTEEKMHYENSHPLGREDAIEAIVSQCSSEDMIVSSTGKISRELFEVREKNGSGHANDFLTVGSMGHCSSIALRIAMNCPKKRIVCIDGDGAALMHMGSLSLIGSKCPENLVHIILDNGAHETVGGMPTVSTDTDFCKAALACGYQNTFEAKDKNELLNLLETVWKDAPKLTLIRAYVALGARADLGRPTRTPMENRNDFMRKLED